jgi:hypothetical protein
MQCNEATTVPFHIHIPPYNEHHEPVEVLASEDPSKIKVSAKDHPMLSIDLNRHELIEVRLEQFGSAAIDSGLQGHQHSAYQSMCGFMDIVPILWSA